MIKDIEVLWGNKNSTKSLVFRILINDHPLKLIELSNLINKRYGKTVTFQAVRLAVLELVKDEVLLKKDRIFEINPLWVFEAKKTLIGIEGALISPQKKSTDAQSVKGEFSTFTFDSLNEMMKFWQQLIDKWFKEFRKGDYPVNCWQGQHIWEALLHLDTEKKVMVQLKSKGIKSYALVFSNEIVDQYIRKFYTSIGLLIKNIPSRSEFDNTFYVGTYGDLIIQAKYPRELVEKIDDFFKKVKRIEDMDINVLHNITTAKTSIKLTVIKNLEMAKQINKGIIDQID